MLYISSACVKQNSIIDSIIALKNITKNIELSGGTKIQNNMLKSIVELRKTDMFSFLVHSYFPPPSEDFVLNFADTSSKTRDFIIKSMKYVNDLDIEYYSIHAGFKKEFNIENELLIDGKDSFSIDGIKENIFWYYSIFEKKLALENLFPNGQNETCFGSHIDEIIEIMDLDKRVYLLLDLGHLKISARFYGFDYLKAVNLLFSNYSNRILEIHLSENNGLEDDHNMIFSDSIQYMILEKYKKNIMDNNINLVIEARGYNIQELKKCYNLINNMIGEKK
ncbi:hypothetical protein [Sulfurimonas sp.]|uniref:hypothetical protein n=1 Tax=Sulfurimonas sp. TaxID=2022749 RepID=UPI003565EB76